MPNSSSPYKMLDYYVESDAAIFGGREQEIFEITSRLASRGILILYGPSGIGKTSVVQAGVFPQIRKLNWRYIYVRTLTNPIDDLASALATGFELTDRLNKVLLEDIVQAVADLSANAPLLLAFDQFEEFFLRFRKEPAVKLKFVKIISDIVERREIDCRILFCMREDYFAHFDEFRRQLPDIFDNSYRIGPLSAFGAREAIVLPLQKSGIQYENRVVNELIAQLAKYNFDPVFLQILCSELVRIAVDRGEVTLRVTTSDLHELGGIEGIFEGYLRDAVDELPPRSRIVARLVLDALISGEQTKQAMRMTDLLTMPFFAVSDELQVVLDALCKYRIVRRDSRGADDWFELVHERLVPIIQPWLRSDVEFFNFLIARDLVEFSGRTAAHHANVEALLNIGQIEGVIAPHIDRIRFDEKQIEFIFLSCIYRDSSLTNVWLERCGYARGTDIISSEMSSSHNTMRIGAVRAVSRLETAPSTVIIRKCLELSLSDPVDAVRRAAGEALGRHADAPAVDELRLAIETRRDAKPLETYADLVSLGRSIPSIGLLPTVKAKRIARKRTIRQHQEFFLNRGRVGLASGAVAAICWALFLVPAWLLVFPVPYEVPRLNILAFGMAISFPVACILGVGLGRMVATHAAKRDALGLRERWWSDLALSSGYWIISVVYLVGILIWLAILKATDTESDTILASAVAAGIVGLCWLTIVPATMLTAQLCAGTNYGGHGFWGWSILAVTVLPTIGAGGWLYIAYLFLGEKFRDPFVYFIGWMPTVMLSTAVSSIVLASAVVSRRRVALRHRDVSVGGD